MKKLVLLLSVLFFGTALFAQVPDADGLYPAPSPKKYCNNFSKAFPEFLNAGETVLLEGKLAAFDKETSNQLVVVIVDELGERTAAQYARDLGNKWGAGQKALNNGIVILVKPTGGAGERDVQISIGLGLEMRIPNVTVQQIIDTEIIPRFKENDFYGALDNATAQLMTMAKDEFAFMNYHPVAPVDLGVRQQAAAASADSTTTFLTWLGIIFGLVIIVVIGFVQRNSWGSDTYCCHNHCHHGHNRWWSGSSWGSGGSSWGGGSSSGGSFGGGSFGGGGGGGKW
ncbi:MAG: hypothetical protein FD123_3019 [Bacteroidetes bacterium]|nr:MAG: hypothetical protein FD123_3019 [Bacteroidota bacterium]